ncbi:MAG: vWA domain-containing protein [Chthoniobacterales bacterium]
MIFLTPLAWVLSALALPLIALYLMKSRRLKRRVSTLLFWDQLKPKVENAPFWRKLRRLFSLLLQLLILFLLIAALARLAFPWEQEGRRHTVFVVDNSPSMLASDVSPSRWEEVLERVRERIARLRIGDEAAIVLMSDPPVVLSGWTSGKRQLLKALSSAGVTSESTSSEAAIRLARELAGLRENSSIEWFTDLVWEDGAGFAPAEKESLRVVGSRDARNVGITYFALRRSPFSPSRWQLDIEVASNGSVDERGRLEVYQGRELLDAVDVDLGKGSLFRKSWNGSSDEEILFTASLKPGGLDQLAEDNEASVQLPALRPVRVLLISGGDFFLEALLRAIPLVQLREATQLPADFEGVDLVVINKAPFPKSPLPIHTLLIGVEQSGFWGTRTGEIKDALITEVDETDPVARHAGFKNVRIAEAGLWEVAAGVRVMASSLGRPIIFGKWDREPAWMVVGFDLEQSDFVLRTAFPVMLSGLIGQMQPDFAEGEILPTAELPGENESQLREVSGLRSEGGDEGGFLIPFLPGWWLVLFFAVLVLFLEWYLYNRRITE